MKILRIAAFVAAGLVSPQAAFAGEAEYAEMVAIHARANGVPEALVHRRDHAREPLSARTWSAAAAPSA